VWPRLQKVFRWYDAADQLAVVAGRGTLRGTPPESSHCNNIGPIHRSKLYPTFQRWFGMPIPEEYSMRSAPEELSCLTQGAIRELQPRRLHELAAAEGARRASEARQRLARLSLEGRKQRLRRDWGRLLGDVEPLTAPKVRSHQKAAAKHATIERIVLEVERGVALPVLLLVPPTGPGARYPVVVAMSQEGKQAFLAQRSEPIAEWLGGGAAVCLIDVRGTGETRPRDGSRRYSGESAAISEAEWMLGQTLVGSRLRDVRSVLRYVRSRADLDGGRVALWGDSFAPVNPRGRGLAVPVDADAFPPQAEPLGGLLALFTALFEAGVRAVYVRGGLVGFESLLQRPFYYVPHDALIPGALTAGDLCDVAASLAPLPLRMEALVDGVNRTIEPAEMARVLEAVRAAYRSGDTGPRLQLGAGETASPAAARWLLKFLLAESAPESGN
jgi:hypothetical protein